MKTFALALFLISINQLCIAQSSGDYRSLQTGLWSNAASWQTYNGSGWITAATAPTATDGVITILSGHTITSNGTVTADQIVVNSGGTLEIPGGTFNIAAAMINDLVCNGTLTLSGGVLNNMSSVAINSGSVFNWSNGGVNGTGVLNANAGCTFNMSGSDHALGGTSTINSYGTWNWSGGTFYYSNTQAPVFNNYGVANITSDADLLPGSANSGTFNNMTGGVINKTGTMTDETSFNNSVFTNAGTININTGIMRFNANIIQNGTINLATGTLLNVSPQRGYFNSGSVLAGAGTVNFLSGVDTIFTNGISVSNINIGSSTVAVNASLSRANGSILNLTGGTISGTGTVAFNSGSTFNWGSGNVGGSGALNVNTGAVCNINNSSVSLIDTRNFNNYGTCTWTGSTFYFAGVPVLNNYGTFNMYTDADIVPSSATTGTFNNKAGGIINKIGSPSDETSISSIGGFTNEGTININSSRINLNLPSLHSGTVNIAFGAQLSFSSGTAYLNTGTSLSGMGILNFTGGADTINSAIITVKNINLTGATVAVNAPLSLLNGTVFNQSGGNLTGNGNFTFGTGSTYNWTSGYHSGSGITTFSSGSTVVIDGTVYLYDTRTIVNNGTVRWQSGYLYYTGAPVFNNAGTFNINTENGIYGNGSTTGTFNNLSGGIINKNGSPGSGSETSINNIRNFINAGTINVVSGRLISNVATQNTGTINMALGANMAFANGNSAFNSGTVLTGDGNLRFESGTDTINAATISVKYIYCSGATITLIPSITITGSSELNLTGGTLRGDGNISIDAGSAFNWSGGYLGGSGTTNITTGASFNVDGTVYLSDIRTINNYGTCNWTNGNFYFFNGAPTINNYSTFNISNDNSLTNYNATNGSFNNTSTGIITKVGSPNSATAIGGVAGFNNAGLINISSGVLALNVNGTHTGTYKIDFGANLGGNITMDFTGSPLTNDGYVTLSGLTFSGTAFQSLNGTGSINMLTISNPVGVQLTESQTIKTNLTVKTNSKLIVYRSLVKQ